MFTKKKTIDKDPKNLNLSLNDKDKKKNKKKNIKNDYILKEIMGIKNIFPYNSSGNACIETYDGFSIIITYSTKDIELLTHAEQTVFEDSIISFLMSLNFPIKYKTTTTKYDLKDFKECINAEKTNNEVIEEYRSNLTNKMEELEANKLTYIRKNYLSVSCSKFPDDKKRTMRELSARLRTVLTGIGNADIKYRILTVNEVYQLFYDSFNKNSNLSIQDLIQNGSFDLYSEGIGTVYNIHSEEENITLEEKPIIQEEGLEFDDDIIDIERIADSDVFENGTISLLDIIKPDVFEEKKDHIFLGSDRLCRMFSISSLPRNLNIGFFNEFFSQLGVVDFNIYIENIPDGQIIRKLSSRYSKIYSNIAIKRKNNEIPDYDQELAAKDLDNLRELIQTNSDRMFYCQILFTIWAKNELELSEKSSLFQDICARKGLLTRALIFDQKNAFINTLPINRMPFKENLRNINTGAGTSLFPIGNTELSHKYGLYYGTNLITNSPIVYDNFIGQRGSAELTNPMIFIVGKPGSGKSVLEKIKISRSRLANQLNVILDPEGEYRNLINKLGGKYITLKSGEKSGINPFDLEVELNDKGEMFIDLYGKMAEIRQMISLFIKHYRGEPLRGKELTGLESALKKLYTIDRGITKDPKSLYEDSSTGMGSIKKQLPILSNLRDELNENEDTKEIAEIMKLITGDSMMAMFDCQSDPEIDIKNPLIAFNLKQLDDFTQYFAMTNILTWIWSKYSNWQYKDLFKTVSIDEGWVFARPDRAESVEFLNQLSRRGRKYKLSLVIASQNIEEFLSTPNGKTIIQLCATKFILKQDPNVAEKIVEFFGLSSNCRGYISNFQKGEALLITESDVTLMKVELFDFEHHFALT
ncbi:VirB4 family type IV secretion system protein [Clostridium argentinense]|nr:ATP-binding protein [Clostridium argentinense]